MQHECGDTELENLVEDFNLESSLILVDALVQDESCRDECHDNVASHLQDWIVETENCE